MSRKYKNKKNLHVIKIFNQYWKFGKVKRKYGDPIHLVIYGSDDKEYHVYGDDIKQLALVNYDWDDIPYLTYHRLSKHKVRLYILTHIIEDRNKWVFDTKSNPKHGERVKVIYETDKSYNRNLLVKWITFNGKWNKYNDMNIIAWRLN